MRLKPHQRRAIAEAEALGVVDVKLEEGSKHRFLVGKTQDGRTVRLIVPRSSSSLRGMKNNRSSLRQQIRGVA